MGSIIILGFSLKMEEKRMEIRFLSANDHKILQVKTILESNDDIKIIPYKEKIEEIQTSNLQALVKDKVIKAFQKIARPVFVEHTGLYLEYLNGLPGGLTQIFWDNLKSEKFAELFGRSPNCNAIAKSIIGYCDSKKIHYFAGEIEGIIAPNPRGKSIDYWDSVFIPNGYDKTYAELGESHNEVFFRRIVLEKFSKFLKEREYYGY